MKKMIKKLLPCVLAFAMLMTFYPAVFAAETAQMTEADAENVTLSATDVNLTQNSSEQLATIYFYMDKNVQISALNVVFTTSDATNIQIGTAVPASELAATTATTAEGITTTDMNGKYVSYNSDVDGYVLFSLPITVSANAVGQFQVNFTVNSIADADNGDGYTIASNSVAATITVTEAPVIETPVTDPYNSDIFTTTDIIDNDGTSQAVVKVTIGGTEETFNSAEIQLTYDPELLSFAAGACLQTAEVKNGQTDQPAQFIALVEDEKETGTLIIRDFGGALKTGEPAYQLTFNIVKGGNATVALGKAGFSTSENAATEDLTVDEVDPATDKADVTINHKATIKNNTNSTTETSYVTPNGNLNFDISEYDATKYTYQITATENSVAVDPSRISVDANGKVTVSGVTDTLVVNYQIITNPYNIEWIDDASAVTSGYPAQNNFGTDLTFTVKNGVDKTDTVDGYHYTVKVYLTADAEKKPLTYSTADAANGTTYTVSEAIITGDVTVEVTKVIDSATEVVMSIEGIYSEVSVNDVVATSDKVNVTKDTSITVKLSREDGYVYVVKTKVGDAEATVIAANVDGSYTVPVGKTAFRLIVEKTLDTASLTVSKYLTMDEQIMWLVQINGLTDTTNKTYTYKADENTEAKDLFWSGVEEYNNIYCYLIITDQNATADTIKSDVSGKLALVNRPAIEISYSGNVNMSKDAEENDVIDVNDAQLVWNMYSAEYGDFTVVSVQKFLEADVNKDKIVDSTDAVAIIGLIK